VSRLCVCLCENRQINLGSADWMREVITPAAFEVRKLHRNVSIHLQVYMNTTIWNFTLTAAVRLRSQPKSCDICGGQGGIGLIFSEYVCFPCQFLSQQLLCNYYRCIGDSVLCRYRHRP
jgi:hypothetical protein